MTSDDYRSSADHQWMQPPFSLNIDRCLTDEVGDDGTGIPLGGQSDVPDDDVLKCACFCNLQFGGSRARRWCGGSRATVSRAPRHLVKDDGGAYHISRFTPPASHPEMV